MDQPIWLAAGLRTPFTKVDGGLAKRDAIGLGVPVLKAMAERVAPSGRIDCAAWGSVIPNLGYSNLARETWLEAGLDPTVHLDLATAALPARRSRIATCGAAQSAT